MRRRIGLFFILVSLASLALFFTSDVVSTLNSEFDVSLGFLFWGVLGFTTGMLLLRGTAPPPQKSERFRLMRRIFGEKKKKDDKGD